MAASAEVEDSARARKQGTSNGIRSSFSLGIPNSQGRGYRFSKPGDNAGFFCALTREYIILKYLLVNKYNSIIDKIHSINRNI